MEHDHDAWFIISMIGLGFVGLIMIAYATRLLIRMNVAYNIQDFDWVQFRYEAVRELSDIPFYNIEELELLFQVDFDREGALERTRHVSNETFRVYTFFVHQTGHIAYAGSAEQKRKVFDRFLKVLEIIQESKNQPIERESSGNRSVNNLVDF